MYYFTDSGRVPMKKIERVKSRTIYERETAYQHRIEEEPTTQQKRYHALLSADTAVAVPMGIPQKLEMFLQWLKFEYSRSTIRH